MIVKLFRDINEKLNLNDHKGEILIVGGAAMCVVYQSRNSTKDVDGVFAPTSILRNIIEQVGEDNGLESDWLNDSVKEYVGSNFDKDIVMQLSNLSVWTPTPDYLLAMKCLSARADSYDAEDIRFLLSLLNISKIDEVLDLVSKYYPGKQILPKTTYFVEEILEELNKS